MLWQNCIIYFIINLSFIYGKHFYLYCKIIFLNIFSSFFPLVDYTLCAFMNHENIKIFSPVLEKLFIIKICVFQRKGINICVWIYYTYNYIRLRTYVYILLCHSNLIIKLSPTPFIFITKCCSVNQAFFFLDLRLTKR